MSEFSGTVAKDIVDLPENETKHLKMADDDNKDLNTKRMEKDFPITEKKKKIKLEGEQSERLSGFVLLRKALP